MDANKKASYIGYVILFVMLCIVYAVGFFTCYSHFYRGKPADTSAVQRDVEEQQRQYEETIRGLTAELDTLRGNSLRARQIVDGMGELLESNDGTIQATISLVRALKAEIENLNSLYTSSSNPGNRDNSGDNGEVE